MHDVDNTSIEDTCKRDKIKNQNVKNSHNYHNVNPRISKNLINLTITATIHVGYEMIFNILEFVLFV